MVVPNLLEPYDFSFLKIRIEGKIVFEVIKKIEASYLKTLQHNLEIFNRPKRIYFNTLHDTETTFLFFNKRLNYYAGLRNQVFNAIILLFCIDWGRLHLNFLAHQ